MKTIINKNLIAGICFIFLASCNEKILDERPLDFLTPENAYSTIDGINQGISGLYANVRKSWYATEDTDQEIGDMVAGLGTDIAFHGEDPNSTGFLCNYVSHITPESRIVQYLWNWNYSIIQRANVLAERIKSNKNEIWKDQSQKDALLAEALFFRAFSYRILTSFFGDVPLNVESVKGAKVDFVRTPKKEVYAQMEEDLLFAAEHLPEPGMEEAPGRITQGVAWHFLSELYLTEGEYQLAVDAASKVIDGYNYALMTERFGDRQNVVFGTGDPYYDLFAFGNQNLPINTESVWVIQYEPFIVGGDDCLHPGMFGPAYYRMGNAPDGKQAIVGTFYNGKYIGFSDTLRWGVAHVRPSSYAAFSIWRSDWSNDIRNAKHNIKRDYYYDNPESEYFGKKIDFSAFPPGTRDPIRDTCQYIYPYFMKFNDPAHSITRAEDGGDWVHQKDIYAVRLAETILLRAEAYMGLGNTGLAAQDINRIRSRANAKPVSASDVNLDYLLDERARELYGEEWRHITLRRVGKFVERVRKYNDNPLVPGLNIQNYHVLFPIPQSQIDLNIGAVIEQNQGYIVK